MNVLYFSGVSSELMKACKEFYKYFAGDKGKCLMGCDLKIKEESYQ